MSKPHAFDNWPKELVVSFGPYPIVFDHARDGDTFEAFVDCGFSVYPIIAVRIAGVNCPELRQPGGPEAKAFLEAVMPRDTPAIIHTHGRSFDRWVAEVTLEDGTNLASLIVEEGHGVFVDF